MSGIGRNAYPFEAGLIIRIVIEGGAGRGIAALQAQSGKLQMAFPQRGLRIFITRAQFCQRRQLLKCSRAIALML